MAYLHGVYTNISPTAATPTVNAASAIPFVVGLSASLGGSAQLGEPVRVSSYDEFLEKFGAGADISEWSKLEDDPEYINDEYYGTKKRLFASPLDEFANIWFRRGGCGECVFVAVGLSGNAPKTAPETGAERKGEWSFRTKNTPVTIYTKEIIIQGCVNVVKIETTAAETVLFSQKYESGKTIITLNAAPAADDVFKISAWMIDGAGAYKINSAINKTKVIDGLNAIDSVYSKYKIVPTMILAPWTSSIPDVLAIMITKAEKFAGDDFQCIAIGNIADGHFSCDNIIQSYYLDDVVSSPFQRSPRLLMCWPFAEAGSHAVELSSVCASVLAQTDSAYGRMPYVSPSNKIAKIDGIQAVEDDIVTVSQLFLTRREVNDKIEAYGVISARNTAKGWVLWGNNTSAYPGSTDPVERFICVQRMFLWLLNDFTLYAQPRIDLPLNRRNIEALARDYEARLSGFIGTAITSAKVTIALDQNDILQGIVKAKILVGVPVPMAQIIGTAEFSVEAYLDSLS